MKLESLSISNGFLNEKHGKYASDSLKLLNVPIISPHLMWGELPSKTVSLALIMQDYDAIPVCGFSWIHWLVANIDPALNGLPENSSRELKGLVQGKNSLASKQICGDQPDEVINFYGGPRPPDKDHDYQFELFALDTSLDLSTGFRMNDLLKAMEGHVIDNVRLIGKYKA